MHGIPFTLSLLLGSVVGVQGELDAKLIRRDAQFVTGQPISSDGRGAPIVGKNLSLIPLIPFMA